MLISEHKKKVDSRSVRKIRHFKLRSLKGPATSNSGWDTNSMQSHINVLCDHLQALDPYRQGMSAEREILAGCRKGKRGKPVSGPSVLDLVSM